LSFQMTLQPRFQPEPNQVSIQNLSWLQYLHYWNSLMCAEQNGN